MNMRAMLQATLLVDCQAELGEAVQWHRASRRVYWTDILGNALWSCREDGSAVRKVDLDASLCDFAFTPDGKMLAAFADGLCWLEPRSGNRRMIEPYDPGNQATRMNDGGLDRQGRFVIGGVHEPERDPVAPVWSISRGKVRTIFSGVGCADGTAFSPDGARMYFADGRTQDIHVYDYDVETGMPSNGRVFAHLRPEHGVPDGSCVDAEGALWNACYGGSAVRRYLADGQADQIVELPVPHVTCCAIGGIRMQRMFITTARRDLDAGERTARPTAGGLYMVDLPVRGLPSGTYRR